MEREYQSLKEITRLLVNRKLSSVSDITQVQLARELLMNIDSKQFRVNNEAVTWNSAYNLNHLIEIIEHYYLTEMSANIHPKIQKHNFYNDPILLWKMILVIGLDGRDARLVSLICNKTTSEHQVQIYQLVEEFLQYVKEDAKCTKSSIQSLEDEKNHNSDQAMYTVLAEEYSQLREKYDKLKASYLNYKKQAAILIKEVQHERDSYQTQKMTVQSELSDHMNRSQQLQILLERQKTKISKLQQQNEELKALLQQQIEQVKQIRDSQQDQKSLQAEIEQLSLLLEKKYMEQIQYQRQIRQLQQQNEHLKENFATQLQRKGRNNIDTKHLSGSYGIQTGLAKKGMGDKQKSTPGLHFKESQASKKNQQLLNIKILDQNIKSSFINEPDNMKNLLEQMKGPKKDTQKLQRQLQILRNQNNILKEENKHLLESNRRLEQIITNYKEDSQKLVQGYREFYEQLAKGVQTGESVDTSLKQTSKNDKLLESYLESYHQRQQQYLARITKLEVKVSKAKDKNEKLKRKRKEKPRKQQYFSPLLRRSSSQKDKISGNRNQLQLNFRSGIDSELEAIVEEQPTQRTFVAEGMNESVTTECNLNINLNDDENSSLGQNREPQMIQADDIDLSQNPRLNPSEILSQQGAEEHNALRNLQRSQQQRQFNLGSFNSVREDLQDSFKEPIQDAIEEDENYKTEDAQQIQQREHKEQVFILNLNGVKDRSYHINEETQETQQQQHETEKNDNLQYLSPTHNLLTLQRRYSETSRGSKYRYNELKEQIVDDIEIRSRRSISSNIYQMNSQIRSQGRQSEYEQEEDQDESSISSEEEGTLKKRIPFDLMDRDLLSKNDQLQHHIKQRLVQMKQESNDQIIQIQKDLQKITQQQTSLNSLYSNLVRELLKQERKAQQEIPYSIQISRIQNQKGPQEVMQILHNIINQKQQVLKELQALKAIQAEKEVLTDQKVKELLSLIQTLNKKLQDTQQEKSQLQKEMAYPPVFKQLLPEEAPSKALIPFKISSQAQIQILKQPAIAKIQKSIQVQFSKETVQTALQTEHYPQKPTFVPKKSLNYSSNIAQIRVDVPKVKKSLTIQQTHQETVQMPKPIQKSEVVPRCQKCGENFAKLRMIKIENELLTKTVKLQTEKVGTLEQEVQILVGAIAQLRQMAKARVFFK